MKITSFNPLIVTKDSENMIALFEEMGFERRRSTMMVSPSGYSLSISKHIKDHE